MRLGIRSQELVVSQEWRNWIERRLRFILGRFGNQVGRVTIDLARGSGSCQDLNKYCRIVAYLMPSGLVSVEVTDTRLDTAVNQAMSRIGPAVDREFMRRRDRNGYPAH